MDFSDLPNIFTIQVVNSPKVIFIVQAPNDVFTQKRTLEEHIEQCFPHIHFS